MTSLGFQLRKRQAVQTAVSIFCLVLLVGCQSIPQSKQGRCSQVDQVNLTDFELSGKLALSDGQEGGSGRFTWRQHNLQVEAQFKAPLGQGDWLIEETDHGASLIVNNEPPYYAQHAESLIEEVVGWSVPWQALKEWLMVRPVDENQANIEQTLTSKTITEQGWTIVYDRFQNYPGGCLPHRIMASNPPYSIRLVVRTWQR
jgi:outer membrane lipoprotein LolB